MDLEIITKKEIEKTFERISFKKTFNIDRKNDSFILEHYSVNDNEVNKENKLENSKVIKKEVRKFSERLKDSVFNLFKSQKTPKNDNRKLKIGYFTYTYFISIFFSI